MRIVCSDASFYLCTMKKQLMSYRCIILNLLMMLFPASIFAAPEHLTLSADSSRQVDLDEVVVVSTPKEHHHLRSSALSSSVFTSAQLNGYALSTMSDVSAHVPTFVVPSYGSRLTSSVYVRGIGSRTGSPSVGFYLDHIPLVNKSTYNRHFFDVDRIDVLRGPQGTLYGVNAEGGLLRAYTKDPLSSHGTEVKIGAAGGYQHHVEMNHIQSLSAHSALSIAGFYSGQKGFFRHAILGERTDRSSEGGGKVRLALKPSDRLRIDVMSEFQYVDQNGFGYGDYDERANRVSADSSTFLNTYRRSLLTNGIFVQWYISPSLLFTSSSGYQYLDDAMTMDQDYLSADYMRLLQEQRLHALTQEVTLRSKSPLSFWQHSSGIFFSHQWLRTNGPVSFGQAMNEMIVAQMQLPPSIPVTLSINDNGVPGCFRTPMLNFGVYHQSTFRLHPRLTLAAGVRYDYQHHSIDYDTQAHFNLAFSSSANPMMNGQHRFTSKLDGHTSDSHHQLLPRLSLTWQIADEGNLYASVSKGFRSGGYNLQMFSDIFRTEQATLGNQLMQLARGDMDIAHTAADYADVNNTISYHPETSWNYEIGTHLNLFSHRLSVDAALFLMQVRNQQLSVMAGNYRFGRMMVNAGRSRSIGGELTLRGVLLDDRLSWQTTYGYTHSTFRNYTDNGVSYRDNYVPFVPGHTLSAMADYRWSLSACGKLQSITFGAGMSANGPTYWDVANQHKQSFYAVADAHLLFMFPHFSVNLWGKNLTNTHYNTFLVESAVDGVARQFAQRGHPIHLGVDVTARF